ncbi:hypothetical protein [Streptomyces sp. NPDC006195]|uniref:hypothetical protein n=1 Tax=unclassified Streptomyces TaxID=2593676 RepID=UPI0033B3846A
MKCPKGGNDFPLEDADGARCERHGITLLWNDPPITENDLPAIPAPCPPCGRCLSARFFELRSAHRCMGQSVIHALPTGMVLSEPQPYPCACGDGTTP